MNNNKYYIRAGNNDDITSIKEVVFTSLMEYGLVPEEFGKDIDLNDIEQSYFKSGGYFGVLIENESNSVIGTFGLYPNKNAVCELRKMYLKKQFRGKGLGKFMMDTYIEEAKQRGFNKIILETISPLKEAIALYKKYGFIEITPAIINSRVDLAFELKI
jgi:GNAT superfamily N-acetyltransferase